MAWAELAGCDRALLEEAIRDAGPRVYEARYRAALREVLRSELGLSHEDANALVCALAALAHGRRQSR
ncbi:MAG: hypothetical protein M5U08_16490 [Burkholderiales bacterium]|nr:hypothetical protein [Burkholderiales bacterium]